MKLSTLIVVCFLGVFALIPGCVSGCNSGYSDGDRVGTISKFSRKGVIFKSWEGEMALGGFKTDKQSGQSIANIWTFHAKNSMANKVKDAMNTGKPVKLSYSQWLVNPIDQDSDYDITNVEVLNQENK